MGFSAEVTCYLATCVLCLFLSSTSSHARKILEQDPLFDELCGDLDDDEDVRVYARPADDVSDGEGTAVGVCRATGWFTKLLEPKTTGGKVEKVPAKAQVNVKSNKKSKQVQSLDVEIDGNDSGVDCSDPDIERAMLSDSIPESENMCDVTEAFPSLVQSDQIARLVVCWPPPYFCVYTTNGRRRLMQRSTPGSGFKVSINCGASTESSSSTRKSDGSNDIDESGTSEGCDKALVSVKVNVNGSEVSGGTAGSGTSDEPDEPDEPGPPSKATRAAAVTVCKGRCCVTTVVKGVMYKRIFETVSANSCQGFPSPPLDTPTKIKSKTTTKTTTAVSGSRSSSRNRFSSD